VDDEHTDWAVRPNQIFAASLPFSMLNKDKKADVIHRVKKELLTTKGLRTLSPKNPDYKGVYEGGQEQRDKAYHQGTVWPWLIGHYVEANFRLYGKDALPIAEKIYWGFEDVMKNAGLGTISEIYDGNPPHLCKGAISQAWSVAEILRIKCLIDEYKEK